MMSYWIRAILALVTASSLGYAGHGEGLSYPLPNADFDAGLDYWTQWASDGGSHFSATPGPGGEASTGHCNLPPGALARLRLSRPIGPGTGVEHAPNSGLPGQKTAFGIWVWLDPAAGGGQVWCAVECNDGTTEMALSESVRIDVDQAPKARWFFLDARPESLRDGRVQPGATGMSYSVYTSAQGSIWFDDARAATFAYREAPLLEGSFEAGLAPGGPWQRVGAVTENDPLLRPDGYYGRHFAVLGGWQEARVEQRLDLASSPGNAPVVVPGIELEAGVWVRVEGTAALPSSPDPSYYVEVRVVARDSITGLETDIARGLWNPVGSDRESWRFLQSSPLATVPLASTEVGVEVVKSFAGDVDIDFVQLGERFGIDGNPRRRVGANYVGRFRSPLFPGTYTTPSAPQDIWRNWCWLRPNACDPNDQVLLHNPDCATSPTCFRANGRRDIAVSPLSSPDDVPLVGAYDSRDADILRYHVDLARSAGIDHFIYDYHGHTMALQELVSGREAINHDTWEALIEVVEEAGCDFKLAAMYEPKVHFQGWVQGQPTFQEKVAGIIRDLEHLALSMKVHRSALRRDGRLVVFVFRNTICTPDGSQCLDDNAWITIQQSVLASTGEDLCLIGDVKPGVTSPLAGLSRWQLVAPEILEYRTYSDFAARTPTLPSAPLSSLRNHSQALNDVARNWAAEDDQNRVAVGLVWPGFDDAGVGGWGATNLGGEDGTPLCVRVAADFDGRFYSTTVDGALKPGCDWIQIATWNDWNENTRIEPAWHPDYSSPNLPMGIVSVMVRQHVFGRLLETRDWITEFKGAAPNYAAPDRIAAAYLYRSAMLSGVVAYD